MATLRAALEAAVVLPPDAYLSLNASPELITSGALRAMFDGVTGPLVLEITEHVAIATTRRSGRNSRRSGQRFALPSTTRGPAMPAFAISSSSRPTW